MTALKEDYPHWSEIDTPWPQQPIAWRLEDPAARDAAYAIQIADPSNTHLVREALVHSLPLPHKTGSANRARTRVEAEDAIAEVGNQFDYLTACGLAVPEVQWYVFESDRRAIGVLARVAIIDGETVSGPRRTQLGQCLNTYRSGVGLRVDEFDKADQYLDGIPRVNPGTEAAYYLVDVDPASWRIK
jgi:hypothetical protein